MLNQKVRGKSLSLISENGVTDTGHTYIINLYFYQQKVYAMYIIIELAFYVKFCYNLIRRFLLGICLPDISEGSVLQIFNL